MPTSTVENYLKSIHRLGGATDRQTRVGIGQIAEDLAVTPGTVTTMMKHLAERDFVDYRLRQGVLLTDEGRTAALRVLRRHRLVELFLVEVMGVDWGAVHDEADALEHAVSDTLVERMDEMLGHPAHDPHGAPIPTADGVLPRLNTSALSECEPGCYRLLRVEEDSSGFLNWLKQHGLLPGTRLTLEGVDHFAETVTVLREGGGPLQIGILAAAKLLVVPDAVPS